MQVRFFALSLGLFLFAALPSPCADPVYVRFNTNLGNIDVELLTNDAPNTVANFLSYVDSGAYNNSFVHRSIPGFVFQGGGFDIVSNTIEQIALDRDYTANPLIGEHLLSNVRGTIAMALSAGPNTGTDEWFFNEVDNSAILDGTTPDNGPFTAFGQVANAASLAIMDSISNTPVFDASSLFGSPFTNLPLTDYTQGDSVTLQNLVFINSITRLTQTFAAWQTGFSTGGPTAVPQKDGVPNLLKYLYDIDPTRPMSATDRAALPVFGMTTISSTQYLTLTYRQNALKTGITVNVQTSSDLKTWTTVSNPTVVQTGTDSTTVEGDPFLQVQVPISGGSQFIRLNVTQP